METTPGLKSLSEGWLCFLFLCDIEVPLTFDWKSQPDNMQNTVLLFFKGLFMWAKYYFSDDSALHAMHTNYKWKWAFVVMQYYICSIIPT